MNQTKLGSLIEAVANTAIGFVISIASMVVILPLLGIRVPFSTDLQMAGWFTIISIARGYILRRWFNARLHAAAERAAAALR